jgi:hypothetical protein
MKFIGLRLIDLAVMGDVMAVTRKKLGSWRIIHDTLW